MALKINFILNYIIWFVRHTVKQAFSLFSFHADEPVNCTLQQTIFTVLFDFTANDYLDANVWVDALISISWPLWNSLNYWRSPKFGKNACEMLANHFDWMMLVQRCCSPAGHHLVNTVRQTAFEPSNQRSSFWIPNGNDEPQKPTDKWN